MKKITHRVVFSFAFMMPNSILTMASLAKRFKMPTLNSSTRIQFKRLSTCSQAWQAQQERKKKLMQYAQDTQRWSSYTEIAAYGIDEKTLREIKEIQASLETIRTGCYCKEKLGESTPRQNKLAMVNKILKDLAFQTERRNCKLDSELHKKFSN